MASTSLWSWAGSGQIEDEPGMAAVVVVAPAEQRGRLIQPGRLQRGQVLRQAVDLLVHIGLDHVADRAWCEFVFLLPPVHKPVAVQCFAAAHVFGQGVPQLQRAAQAVAHTLQVCIAKVMK